MKNKLKLLATIGILAFASTSCIKEWLDVMPKNMQPADIMFDTYQGYQDALIGCYTKMKSRNLWGENLTITTIEYIAQHWEKGNSNQNFITTETLNQFKDFNYDDVAVKAAFTSIWSGLYNIIVQANSIIEAIPLTAETVIGNPAARGIVEGEALAIRAMCHFEVLRLFGQFPENTSANLLGTPLVATQNVNLPYSKTVSRNPVTFFDYQAYIDLLEKDLERAAELLLQHDPFVEFSASQINSGNTNVSDDFLRSRQLRLNYYAVKALQARFYLYIGKNAEANRAAMEVIEAASTTKGFNLASNESDIRDRYYALPNEGLFMLSNHQLDNYWNTIFPIGSGSNLHMSMERLEIDMFGEAREGSSNNRLRELWLRRTASDLGGAVIYQPMKYNLNDSTRAIGGINLIRYKQVMPMLRLSELYLIAMETGSVAEANRLFREYRIARDVQPFEFASRREILQEIEAEYRRELFAEGQMFAFYKRFRKSTMLWRYNEDTGNAIFEKNYIVPLPDTEFSSNF